MHIWLNNAYIYVASGILVIAILIVLLILIAKPKSRSSKDIKEVDGVRYSTNENKVNSYVYGDILLKRGKKYKVKKGSEIIPGKYTILSADEEVTEFNIRLGNLVREYRHNSSIVLSEEDEICAVSHNVILR